MKKIAILGASGQIAQHVIDMLAERGDTEMTLFLRDVRKLGRDIPDNARVIEGDVHDTAKLRDAVSGQDVVYANLAGDVDAQAAAIITVMKDAGSRKLIFAQRLAFITKYPANSVRGTTGKSVNIYRHIARLPISWRHQVWIMPSCALPG